MTDDRAASDIVAELVELRRELKDLRGTALERASRLPTGTITKTLATIPPTGALLCDGGTKLRADYPALWQWVADHNALGFGPGNGTTTFTLPNMQGRFVVGAGTLGGDVYAPGAVGGSTLKTLTDDELPQHSHTTNGGGSHSHGGGTGGGGAHEHGGGTDLDGGHGGHTPTAITNVAAGPDMGVVAWNATGATLPQHNHGITTDNEPSHGHSITGENNHTHTVNNAGLGAPFDGRPTYFACNFVIWT